MQIQSTRDPLGSPQSIFSLPGVLAHHSGCQVYRGDVRTTSAHRGRSSVIGGTSTIKSHSQGERPPPILSLYELREDRKILFFYEAIPNQTVACQVQMSMSCSSRAGGAAYWGQVIMSWDVAIDREIIVVWGVLVRCMNSRSLTPC